VRHDIERSLRGRGLGPKVATDGVRDAVRRLYAVAIYTDILYPPQINPIPSSSLLSRSFPPQVSASGLVRTGETRRRGGGCGRGTGM